MSTRHIVINGKRFSKTIQQGISGSSVVTHTTYGINEKWVKYEAFMAEIRKEISDSGLAGTISLSLSDIWR